MNKSEIIKSLGRITVTAMIPPELKELKNIAYNLWWSWNSDAIDLYRSVDLPLWTKVGKNPIRFLQEVSQSNLEKKIKDLDYMKSYEAVVNSYRNYMSSSNTWFSSTHPDKENCVVAYFCAEYGLHDILQLYSGGLGVLAGDHCKAASDLGIPFVALGLFYKHGYFNQHINREGWQETTFETLTPSQLPVTPALDNDSQEIYIGVEFPGRIVYAKIWQIQIGRVKLYLMDSDIPQNNPDDRLITSKLYGGDREIRIQQEIFLGIGGVKVLEALNIEPSVYHMNEGHSAFMGLELIRKLVQNRKLSFINSKEIIASCTVFTTHTPVPAGTDVFPIDMMDKYFGNYWGSLGINRHEFLDLGLKAGDNQGFNMTVLALNLAGNKNGVSELHGAVSRNIFKNVWPSVLEEDIPISHITNGIHTLTWLSPSIKTLYDKYFGTDWVNHLSDIKMWDKIEDIPDEELWNIHNNLKLKMILFLRAKIKAQKVANNESLESLRHVDFWLNPNALTIGFARRFATYKRANLLFRNLARIERLLNNTNTPVQVIFAGKAHPADTPGQEVIKNIYSIANKQGFTGKVVLIEDYNMAVARNLVQGVDVWLNNPRRPLEASGTSGQKASINGAINFSVLDGWWCEGYNGINGWSIGDDSFYDTQELQDDADSESIYDVLENQIIPLFFYRDKRDIPTKWVAMMKQSIKTLSPVFSTDRMVQEYATKMYVPCMRRMEQIVSSDYSYTLQLSDWKSKIIQEWPNLQILSQESPTEIFSKAGDTISIPLTVQLGRIDPSSITVELCYGHVHKDKEILDPHFVEMKLIEQINQSTYRYSADIKITSGGDYGYTFRLLPNNPYLINKFEMNLVKWIVL